METKKPDRSIIIYGGKYKIDFYNKLGRKSHVYEKTELPDGVPEIITLSPSKFCKYIQNTEYAFTALPRSVIKMHEEGLDFSEVWRKKRDVGTDVHSWIESYIRQENPEMPKEGSPIYWGVKSFLAWDDEVKPEYLGSERLIYSEKYNYVGLIDAVAKIGGKVHVIDFKTGGERDYYKYQVQAYKYAFEEENKAKTGDAALVYIGIDEFSYKTTYVPDKDFARHMTAIEHAIGIHYELNTK